MPYPIFPAADARRYMVTKRGNAEANIDLRTSERDLGENEDWESIIADLREALDGHKRAITDPTKGGAKFEAAAAKDVHRILPRNHPALSDPEFWMWLAIVHFIDVIEWRYGNPEAGCKLDNYGIGSRMENFLYRLWLRADIAYDTDASDPYRLCAVGDIDFWRSHLFRQRYTNARPFARAFLRFQFPDAGAGKSKLSIKNIRRLATQLRRALTNIVVEMMDEVNAMRFIEFQWEQLESSETN